MTKNSTSVVFTILVFIASVLSACQASTPTQAPLITQAPAQPASTQAISTPLASSGPSVEKTTEATLPIATDGSQPSPTPTDTPIQPPATSAAAAITPTVQLTATVQASSQGNAIIIDHTSVELFEKIPDEYLEKARNLNVMYVNQSVGKNISLGLDCLTATSWTAAPAYCRRDYVGASWEWKFFGAGELSLAPERIRFEPDPVKYDRSRWTFVGSQGTWYSSVEKFVTSDAPQYRDKYDVLSLKITYLMVADNSDINDPETGFFAADSNRFGWKDLQALKEQNPDKVFFFWTSSLSRSIGSQNAVEFNERMRQIASEQGLFLFDIADIESHTDTGQPCYDNRDGIEYCTQAGKCENNPDDNLNLPAICQDYTTETDGGHLGSVSGGSIRLAKAFWVLIARIAGWQP